MKFWKLAVTATHHHSDSHLEIIRFFLDKYRLGVLEHCFVISCEADSSIMTVKLCLEKFTPGPLFFKDGLLAAIRRNDYNLVKLLLEYSDGPYNAPIPKDALSLASKHATWKMVNMLIKHKAPVSEEALLSAVTGGKRKVVFTLLGNGCTVTDEILMGSKKPAITRMLLVRGGGDPKKLPENDPERERFFDKNMIARLTAQIYIMNNFPVNDEVINDILSFV